MKNILELIIDTKKIHLKNRKRLIPRSCLVDLCQPQKKSLDFISSIRKECPSIIAEIKYSSPSKGRIVDFKNPTIVAQEYIQSKAEAISIVTEVDYFKGHDSYLEILKNKYKNTPMLRKDFIIDDYQLYESKVLGADAVLLIASVLKERLSEFVEKTNQLGMTPLVEISNKEEAIRALQSKAQLVGVNNRDLHDFSVSIKKSKDLYPLFPSEITLVSESGIHSKDQINELFSLGYHAFLVGSSLMKNPRENLNALKMEAS